MKCPYCYSKIKHGSTYCDKCSREIGGEGEILFSTFCDVKSDSGLSQDCDVHIYKNGIVFCEPEHHNGFFTYNGGLIFQAVRIVDDKIRNRHYQKMMGFLPFDKVISCEMLDHMTIKVHLNSREISYYKIEFKPDVSYEDIYGIIKIILGSKFDENYIDKKRKERLSSSKRVQLIENIVKKMDNYEIIAEIKSRSKFNYDNIYADGKMIVLKGYVIYQKLFGVHVIPISNIENVYAFRERRNIGGSTSTAIFYFMRIKLKDKQKEIEFDGKYLNNHAQFTNEILKYLV